MKRQILVTLAIAALDLATSFAQSNAQFAKANQEFAAGDFKGAIADYESLVRARQDTANLFYNLGNAYFRTKDFGRAILNYERALALDRHHPEAEANLRIARDDARALELSSGKWERFFGFGNENEFLIAAVIAFWIFAFALTAFFFKRRRGLVALSILSLLIFAVAVFTAYQLEQGRNGSSLAVVTADNTEARLATADNASRVLTLPAGSEIKIISQRGDWIYAALPNDLRGWMPANSAEQVRL